MDKLTRRQFTGGASASAAALAMAGGADAHRRRRTRPNILFILADDFGWGDLSAYGRRDYETPVLDELAFRGTRLTNAYSASPVCSATRVAWATGRYPGRLDVGLFEPMLTPRLAPTDAGLPPTHPTIASLLKQAGYETALYGKWHLGWLPGFSPIKSGFDEYFGTYGGGIDYFSHVDVDGAPDLWEDETPTDELGYFTNTISDRAIEFITRRRSEPFYLSLHYTAPHWPWEGPKDQAESQRLTEDLQQNPPPPGRFRPVLFHRDGGSLEVFAEMVRAMDAGVGRVLRALERHGRAENTLVIFTSDNGGERFSYHWPLDGAKGSLREGGIRVPALIRWPRELRPNRVSSQVTITQDLTASMLAAAGAAPNPAYPLDGEDILPVLRGNLAEHPRRLFWRFQTAGGAVRDGSWKYLRDREGVESLFDLDADAREQANRARQRPHVLEQLRAAYEIWNAEMLPYTARHDVPPPTP